MFTTTDVQRLNLDSSASSSPTRHMMPYGHQTTSFGIYWNKNNVSQFTHTTSSICYIMHNNNIPSLRPLRCRSRRTPIASARHTRHQKECLSHAHTRRESGTTIRAFHGGRPSRRFSLLIPTSPVPVSLRNALAPVPFGKSARFSLRNSSSTHETCPSPPSSCCPSPCQPCPFPAPRF